MKFVNRNDIQPFDFRGLKIFEMTPETPAGSPLSFAEIVAPQDTAHQWSRSSRSDKIYFGIEGEIEFELPDGKVVLTPGSLLVIEQGEWFSYVNREQTPGRMFLIHHPSFIIAAEEFLDERPDGLK